MSIQKVSFSSLFIVWSWLLSSQSVLISPEINVKNDFSYFVLAHPNGTISLLRDKSFKISFQTLFPDFQWSIEKTIELPGKKWRLIDFFENGNDIDLFYTSKLESEFSLNRITYNSQAVILNQRTLFEGISVSMNENLKIQNSEDKNWVGIGFNDLKSDKHLLLYNRQEDSVYYVINLELIVKEENISIQEVESNSYPIFIF